jgi:putative DNA primase/helicase
MEHSYQRLQTFEELRANVAGQWGYIFEDLAPELAEALARAPNHVSCPVHGGIDGFRLYRDYQETGGGVCNTCGPFRSGFQLLAWVRGYSNKDATRDVGRWHRGEQENPTTALRTPKKVFKSMDPTKAYERIREVWLGSKPLAGSAAELYLAKRGIWKQNMPTTLRFHPGLSWFDPEQKKSIGVFPCLIAPIKDA